MQALSELSLTEKIGQMVMCGFYGSEPSASILQLIDEYRLGGVIYFSRNIESPKQVYDLSRSLQYRAKQSSGIPLWIGIDQEGGMVARITEGVTLMPGNMALGASGDVHGVFEAANVTGCELKALGINMNFAPSLDVNNNPHNPVIGVRSFGDDPRRVGELGAASVQGYRKAGLCAVVKHFPGHGDTAVDSHFSLPVIPHDCIRVERVELVPFKRVIKQGVDAVMTAHVVFPALDPTGRPATLSPRIVTELLREELGYHGMVITDCLEMDAIAKYYGTEKAAVMAIEAGVDMVLISHRYERQVGALQAIHEAVENGKISEARIDQSVERILRLKQKRNREGTLLEWEQAREILHSEKNREVARKLSEKSITVLKDDHSLLPLDKAKTTYVIWPEIQTSTPADEDYRQGKTLAFFLAERMDEVFERTVSVHPNEKEIKSILKESASFDQIVAVTYNTALFGKQSEWMRRLLKGRNGHVVVVAVRDPFDFIDFPEASTQIASYETRPLAMQSTAKMLTGEIKPAGKLPVDF